MGDFDKLFKSVIESLPDEPSGELDVTASKVIADYDAAERHHRQAEVHDYPVRVRNLRFQFAWASIMLAFAWVFIIIFIVLSHAVGCLFAHLLRSIMWGAIGCVVAASIIYGIFMSLHSHHVYRSSVLKERRHLAILHRRLAANFSIIFSPILGIVAFFISETQYECRIVLPFERLTSEVLTVLITSTTISVLGILGAVMFWLFPRKKVEDEGTQENGY